MMKPFAPHANFGKLLTATVIGFTGIVLLGRPGELIRPYLIAVREKTLFFIPDGDLAPGADMDLLIVLAMFGFALSQVHIDPSTLGPGMQWLLRTAGFSSPLSARSVLWFW